eukprot:TRINITY_DN29811_c0_g1_i1.p2 TRINITY_DN29811_c0_g1~~TRINITY_DN29811_c0_g1_i1.p2  ORF type:complete len:112 (+),score=29.70 TRINITY_DN29811_c0_g1_i1:55-390(+)
MGGAAHLSMTAAAMAAGCAAKGFQQKSTEAFLGSALCAAGMGTSSALVHSGEDLAGHMVGAATGAVTGFFFTRRYMSLRHPFMPNGLLMGTALAGGAYNAYKANDWLQAGW